MSIVRHAKRGLTAQRGPSFVCQHTHGTFGTSDRFAENLGPIYLLIL